MTNPLQNESALEKNKEFFADNKEYKTIQSELEHYRFIALSAAESVTHSRSLLDVGNGGLFIYPIEHIPHVVAIDLFVEDDFAKRYPRVIWKQMSALDMFFSEEFDTITEINTLHHIVGSSVQGTYDNLNRFFQQAHKALIPSGKLVLLESTVPRWFIEPYKLMFPILLKAWPLKHPPTFQFHFRDILKTAEAHAFTLKEFCWIPKTSDVLAFGKRVRPWLSPIKTAKFVFERKS